MKEFLLAIDAATASGGVAVSADGVVLAEAGISDTRRHSELLLPAVDFVLHASGVERTNITGIVVGAGPGSFTGVRIAAAMARGLAAGLGVPLLAYSSLAGLAASAARGLEPVCAMFDARRGEVYAGCYAFGDDGMTTILPPTAATVEQIVERLAADMPLFAGDGAQQYLSKLPRARVLSTVVQTRASALLWLAHYDRAAGAVALPASFEPDYVREPAAARGLDA
jgi:tRNA threonylcarbamoyladenosine biosynthesis protein TsaB